MVLALAGDSTMTSDEPPALSAPVSISVAAVFFVRFPAVFLAAMSVYRFPTFVRWRGQSGAFDQRAQIVQRDPSVDLHQGPLDQLLQLRGRDRAGTREDQQLPPGLRREPSTFVRSENSEGHLF